MNIPLFLTIRFLDILDILLVATLIYQLHKLIKGTAAFNIFIAIFTAFLGWHLVKALNMELISGILGQLFGVGAIALIIVFQQEIRRFLLMLGTKYRLKQHLPLDKIFSFQTDKSTDTELWRAVVDACDDMSKTKTGALIVVAREAEMEYIVETGEKIDAVVSRDLLRNIFFKNSPLHDGAVVVYESRLRAARCILPVTEKLNVDPNLGLRHRAAIGITEQTDAIAIVVSEETGRLSVVENGSIFRRLSKEELFVRLQNIFNENTNKEK